MNDQRSVMRRSETANVADILERILDKGIVIAGDIKVNLMDIELLTVQIRLVVCSIDKAVEMGIDWWANNPAFSPRAKQMLIPEPLTRIEERLARVEDSLINR